MEVGLRSIVATNRRDASSYPRSNTNRGNSCPRRTSSNGSLAGEQHVVGQHLVAEDAFAARGLIGQDDGFRRFDARLTKHALKFCPLLRRERFDLHLDFLNRAHTRNVVTQMSPNKPCSSAKKLETRIQTWPPRRPLRHSRPSPRCAAVAGR